MKDHSVKLGYFSILSYLKSKYCGCRDPYGSLTYMAPEVFEEGAGDKSDVWSFGITLIELAERQHPYVGLNRNELVEKLINEPPPSLSNEEWTSEFADFVNKCLVKDANERWSVRELLDVGY